MNTLDQSGREATIREVRYTNVSRRFFSLLLAARCSARECEDVIRMDVVTPISMETAANMYISNEPQNGHTTTKYASTNSIPAMIQEQESSLARILGAVGKQRENAAAILRDGKGRRHSVLEDLKARRDSLFQRARRASMFSADEKENAKDNGKDTAKEKPKDKRRSSDAGGARRGSVFYVSEDLLEENHEIPESEDRAQAAQEAKKGRRKSWHPLAKPPKVDRKRRKGVVAPSQTSSTEGLYPQVRQKRPSWWNIFVPDSVTRYLSRRHIA